VTIFFEFIVINPLTPSDLLRRRAASLLKITIPSKKLGRQRCAEGFNSGVEGLIAPSAKKSSYATRYVL
jgi:hypothetical protein